MASALASQLQQLREAGAGSKRRTDTFLYDQREAACLDDETVYNLAWNGLLELKQLDAQFESLLADAEVSALFSRQRIQFRRAQSSKQDEPALNAALHKLLDALSAYFLLGATHKVLEFLVRRYEIHRYNIDGVMAAIVAYHESSWFVRMVRILHISNTRWEFLLPVKRNGTPLLRAALVRRASDESSVIEFIFQAATRIGAANPKLTSLYTLVVLQMLEQTKVTEQMLRWLVPHLLSALKSVEFPELQSSAYMIVTKLASKATLTDKVVDALVKSLVKHAQPGAQMNALLCVIFLAQTQPAFQLTTGAGKHLVQMENAADFLRDATFNYESAKFLQLLTLFLTQQMKSTDDEYLRLLITLIESVSVVDELSEELVETLVAQAEELDFSMDNERVQAISQGLVALSKKNAVKVDTVVNGLIAQQGDNSEEDKKLNTFLTKTFENVANSAHFVPSHTDANTSLALALDHPTEHIRYQALVSLAKMNDASTESPDKNQVLTSGDVLLRRVLDDSKRIASFMVTSSLGDLVLSLSTKKKMLDSIVQALHKWSTLGETSVTEAIADFTLKKFRETTSSDNDDKLLTVFVSLVTHGNSTKQPAVSIDTVWNWISILDHPFSFNAAKASQESNKTIEGMAENFGCTLAVDVQGLLPYCLSWSEKSELTKTPLTRFLIEVLSAARAQLTSTKSTTKKTKEKLAALDTSFRFILQKEFVSISEENSTDEQIAHAVTVASKLSEVSFDVFAVSRDEFDGCVATLLMSPTPVFIRVQECLINLFHADLEAELLPTMARLVTVDAPTTSALKVLVKTRALDIISAVLEGYSYSESEKELKQLVHVIPVVMVALSDPSKAVRTSAISCLNRWVTSCGDAVLSSTSVNLKILQKATTFFLEAKQDILMDSNSVTALCGTYSAHEDSSLFHQLLMNFVSSASNDEISIAVKLLELLAPVKTTSLWMQSVDFFQQALGGCALSGAGIPTTKLLIDFIGHYLDVDTAVTISTKGKAVVSKKFLDTLLAVLSSETTSVVHLRKLQVFALTNLSATFYEALDEVARHVLVDRLLRLLMVADETVASRLIQCLNTLPISFNIFVRLIEEALTATVDFPAVSCILEVLVVKVDSAENADADISKLLTSLANVLTLFCDPKHESVVSEYILQVLFSCLRRVCEVSSSSINYANGQSAKAVKHAVADLKPELLVKHTLTCLGRTSSPQTRNEAVLFISSLVNLHPASVLTSLDKILSFVSSGSIRSEDEYSFYVLETIIKAVVPHILATKNEKSGALITSQRFIGLFVDAFAQIPKGKRIALFEVVVRSLGSELLPYCIVALLQHAAVATDIDVQRERIQFAHNLCFSFDCPEQVSCLVMVLRMARDLLPHVLENADTDTDEMDEDEDDVEYERFVLDERLSSSNALARQFNSILVKFVTAHLRARELHHKILRYENERDQSVNDEDVLQHQYLMLAQLDLLYFRRVAQEQSVQDDASGFWTALATESIEILGALQQLMSTPGFVAVISELLHHDNSLVRKKAMQLFNERLQEERDTLTSGEALLFIDMLDELDSILQNADGSENSVNIQTALLSVDILARNFAAEHTKRFKQILPTVVNYVDQDIVNAPAMTLHLFGCAFVCLSSICRAVGPVVFPLLPKFFPRLLSGIEYCSSANGVTGTRSVLQCLLASLEVFTSKIPQFLGPYLPSVIRALLTPAVLSSSTSNAEVLMSVDCCFLNLCNHVELRQLLPNLVGAYEHVLTLQSDTSVIRLFSVVGTVVDNLELPAIRKHLPSFARFFVTALDARRVHASKLQDLDAVEDEVLECLVQFILKLSEKQLKPLFLKLAEWAQTRVASSGKTGDISRKIAFFKLVVKLSERLRGILVPYYAHMLEFLTSSLRESRKVLMQKPPRSSEDSESEDDDDFFASGDEPPVKKAKLGASSTVDAMAERERNTLLLTSVVRALDGCFVHDNDGFIEKERFDIVMAPLVDVVDVLQYDTSMRDFVLETLAPCLANLAWAAKSDLLWKPLHYAVLMKSRGDCAPVRLAALVTVEKCYQVIGDEFLAMLPESIPFLAELMEDTDDEVEKTCHRVIKQIEDISGESLDQYLTT